MLDFSTVFWFSSLFSLSISHGSVLFIVLFLKTGACFESEFRAKTMKKWSLLWPFWAILAIHGVAILIFVKGFLLTRTELPYFSHCSDVSQSPCFTLDSLSHSNPSVPSPSHKANFSRCWTNPTVNRIIIIVFDALRFFSSSFPACFPSFIIIVVIIIHCLLSDSIIFVWFVLYLFVYQV